MFNWKRKVLKIGSNIGRNSLLVISSIIDNKNFVTLESYTILHFIPKIRHYLIKNVYNKVLK